MTVDYHKLLDHLGRTDIYLIDQMMKGRYQVGDTILDAGCGHGRNAELFIKAGFQVFGVDHDPEKVTFCEQKFPEGAAQFTVQQLDNLSFEDNFFHHIISSAVFHFCTSTEQFHRLFAEHIRVLRPGGTFFIRMTSRFGLPPGKAFHLGKGVYQLPGYGSRFLMTHDLIHSLFEKHALSRLEPVKTVNVQDQRAMAVLVLKKH